MEANRASEAMKVAFRSNMPMDSRVIEVAGFKFEAIFSAPSLATIEGQCHLFVFMGHLLFIPKRAWRFEPHIVLLKCYHSPMRSLMLVVLSLSFLPSVASLLPSSVTLPFFRLLSRF